MTVTTTTPAPTATRTMSPRATGAREIEGRDSVGLYLDEIARTPLLDAATEVELSKAIEAGLMAEALLAEGRVGRKKGGAPGYATVEELEFLAEEGRKAVDHFITANLRLVVSIARKYGRAQMPMLDLIQEGNTGLIRAVEKFDYTKGYKFSTYATWWVRQAITRGIAQQARVVRLPVHVVEELNQIGGARRTLERQLGRDPEPHEIAEELGLTLERVLDLMAWGREHVSLDSPLDEDGDTSLGDLMAQESQAGVDLTMLDVETRERLNELVDNLDDRSADIIRSRYGLVDGRQHKLADIGAKHGISAERVRQLEREALQKLRRIADPDLAA
jgi:RNA polymerase primary sigma factor